MELNEASVNAHFELMTNPQKYNLPIRSLSECFEPSEEVTAQHILFRDYQKESPACMKIFFYIVMHKVHGMPHLKDSKGNLGFALKYVEAPGWKNAFLHFDGVRKTYEAQINVTGVNVELALENVFKPLAARYENGERSEELHDAMMAVE